MLTRLMATVQSVRSAPPSKLSPLIAATLILVGSRMLGKYTAYQRAVLLEQAQELGALVAHVQALRTELGPDVTPATVYPAPQDVDPLHRAGTDPAEDLGDWAEGTR